ncbi:unnamed protein product [Urochloa humidicola]
MASVEIPMENILDESIEQANRLLESQELLNQAQDMVIENEQVDKIYAECGPKEKFANIDWAQVERNLNHAGAVAKPKDEATGTSLLATIVGSSGKSAVGAIFLG